MPTWPERYALQLQRYRRVLESAPNVLLSWTREDNGETRLPCPWLEAIQTFHELAWRDDLHSPELEALLDDATADFRRIEQRFAAAQAAWDGMGSVPRPRERDLQARFGKLGKRFVQRRRQEEQAAAAALH